MKVSQRLSRISPSLTLAVTGKAKAMKKEGIDVISFAAGEPDFDTPAFIRAAACRAIEEGKTRYTPAKGMPELVEAVREKFLRENGLEYSASQIVISCGAKHSLYNAFTAVLDPGDEVIIPSPYWVTYPEQVGLAGGVPVFLDSREDQGYRLDFEALQAALSPRTRAIVVASPCNPSGGIYPVEDLEKIADLAVSRGLIVVSDEIYEHLVFDGFRSVSIASLSPKIKDHTIVVNGVSKAYAMTGWRIGYLAAPEPVAKAISSFQSHSTSNPATMTQYAALAALKGDQGCVEEMRLAFEGRRDAIMDRFSRIEGITCVRPTGTFYTFPNISAFGLGSLELADRLLEEARIAVVPGIAFGWDTNIRMSFADSLENIMRGIDRFEEFLSRLRV
ncbi:MAG TPA: pyridoxal phosphate-dependent aminotransferase [bacterium]|nr:pyridoxal phosphate-dependent aminotransferase [bacterium]HPQ66382.1 pyridoxal phosphate-dependent aminotransferase [bacterium]